MKVDLKLTGVDGVMDTLRSLPAEVVSKNGGPVKAALRKGARVILLQAQANLQAVTSNATASGERESTGLLKENLVVTRGKEPVGTRGERYLVRVRRKGYAGRSAGSGKRLQGVSTLKTAQLLEYGSVKQPPEPWLRPAFQARAREAIDTATRELVAGLDRVVKRLAAKNKGK
jgi:HK97 gp10 family phage protein